MPAGDTQLKTTSWAPTTSPSFTQAATSSSSVNSRFLFTGSSPCTWMQVSMSSIIQTFLGQTVTAFDAQSSLKLLSTTSSSTLWVPTVGLFQVHELLPAGSSTYSSSMYQ